MKKFYDLPRIGACVFSHIFTERHLMRKHLIVGLLIIACLMIFPLSGFSLDGEKLYIRKFCVTCHGETGFSVTPNYPSLANQNLGYLINQVKDILTKKRSSKLTLLMTDNPVIMTLTDEEIQAISEYLNQFPGK